MSMRGGRPAAVEDIDGLALVSDAYVPDHDLTALFRQSCQSLIGMAWVLLGDRASAEEVVQDAFISLQRAWPSMEGLKGEYGLLDQLHTAFAAKEGATSASPAQWRAQESTDSLCGRLLEQDRAEISSASQVFESPLRAVAV